MDQTAAQKEKESKQHQAGEPGGPETAGICLCAEINELWDTNLVQGWTRHIHVAYIFIGNVQKKKAEKWENLSSFLHSE